MAKNLYTTENELSCNTRCLKKPKLMVVGHARHGKDTVCDILVEEYDFKFISSSRFCSQHFIFDKLKDKYGYQTEEECFNDRHNHRAEWFNLIQEYCTPDAGRLGKKIFREYDIYCGLRNKAEFHSMKNQNVFDYSIWVDASDRLPPESKDSMTIEPWMSDFVIDNNTEDLEILRLNVRQLMNRLLQDLNGT